MSGWHGRMGIRTDTTTGVSMAARTVPATTYVAPHQPHVRYHQGDTRFIIELMRRGEDNLPMGQVVDLDWGLVYAPMPIGSILARGYWEQLAKPFAAADLLAKVRQDR